MEIKGGGPDRDRTGDLMNAIHARSQLRYWPTRGVRNLDSSPYAGKRRDPNLSRGPVDNNGSEGKHEDRFPVGPLVSSSSDSRPKNDHPPLRGVAESPGHDAAAIAGPLTEDAPSTLTRSAAKAGKRFPVSNLLKALVAGSTTDTRATDDGRCGCRNDARRAVRPTHRRL